MVFVVLPWGRVVRRVELVFRIFGCCGFGRLGLYALPGPGGSSLHRGPDHYVKHPTASGVCWSPLISETPATE